MQPACTLLLEEAIELRMIGARNNINQKVSASPYLVGSEQKARQYRSAGCHWAKVE
ncbi:hypothetical protein RP20_CCG020791 [Aedes albopictus]|nr:hypothetical protein RP20_CCG020791 [Aedes albopictus]